MKRRVREKAEAILARQGSYRRNSEYDDSDGILHETIEPYMQGKGPVFEIETWHTGKVEQKGIRRGLPFLLMCESHDRKRRAG